MASPLTIRGIKILDIAYLSGIYVAIGLSFSVLVNSYFGRFDPNAANKKSIVRLLFEVWLHLCLITVSAYIIHNIVEKIPFPLDGLAGFKHSLVKERGGGIIFGFLLFFYQTNLRDKITYIIRRLGYQ